MNTIRKALNLLSRQEKRRGTLVLVLVLIMATLETAGVASIMPFLAVLGNPELVQTQPVLLSAYEFFGFQSVDAFLMALGLAAFAMVLFSALFRIVTHYAMHRFIEMRRHSIGERLLETYLRQPYAFFLNRHSSDMAKTILSEVDQIIGNVYRPGMLMVAYSVVLLALITLLIVVDPILAVSVAAIIGGIYALIFLAVRGILDRSGKDRAEANRERFTAAGEALAGIKSIKILGREQAYLSRFRGPSIRTARHQVTHAILGQVPKFVIEAVGFGGVIVLTLVLLVTRGGATGGALGEVLPLLGLYVFAGYRILPAAQYIYSGLASLRFGAAAVEVIHDDLQHRAALAQILKQAPQRLSPRQAIVLEDLSYAYPNAEQPALKDINLSIPVGSSVGLVGATGSGKTTLVDVILGLLRPQQGAIRVDDEPVTEENLRAWQQTLGYVPQEIFLTDSTIAENIALGVPQGQIDHQQVARCARLAQIHDFIMNDLPSQYATVVGERGVRLSGGQRQRIGIARALYHDPDILVFDEATSALDMVTEHAVIETIETLSKQKTIILIAHRLSTVQACDQILVLEKGRMVGIGTYEALLERNTQFQELAKKYSSLRNDAVPMVVDQLEMGEAST